MNRTLVVGLGSSHGEDQAGWLVADQLARLAGRPDSLPDCTVRRALIPLDLLDWLGGVERLVLCDACEAIDEPGRLHRWTWPDPAIAGCRSLTSHDFDLSNVLQMAAVLGQLPREVTIWGIELSSSPVQPLSAADLDRTVQHTVATIRAELEQHQQQDAPNPID